MGSKRAACALHDRQNSPRSHGAKDLQGDGDAALTAASASCFFCRMSVAVLSLCFSSSLMREKEAAREERGRETTGPLAGPAPANSL